MLPTTALGNSADGSGVSATFAAPLPIFSNTQIANYIQTSVGADFKYNLKSTGTNPQNGVLTYNVSGLNAAGIFLADHALKLYETVLPIDFVKFSGTADITFDDNLAGLVAQGGFSFFADGTIFRSFVTISASWLTSFGSALGSYGFQTYLHEIGHALGLGHAGPYDGFGNYVTNTNDPDFGNNSNIYLNDSWQATMMSYFSQADNTYVDASFAYLISPMVADWIALGNKYETSTAAFAGNTVWGFNSNVASNVFANLAARADDNAFTIFDAGGIDTLDFSGYAAKQVIDLRPEAVSSIGGLVGNMTIARGTTIENAIGGSGHDTIHGNALANDLKGRSGNDRIYGWNGNDKLFGDAGADQLHGGAGNDTLNGGNGGDRFNGGLGRDILVGGAGFDVFFFLAANGSGGDSPAGSQRDVIMGFDAPGGSSVNGDVIDLSSVHSGTLTFGTRVRLSNSGNQTIVSVNNDADPAYEVQIQIDDGATLAANYLRDDFFL